MKFCRLGMVFVFKIKITPLSCILLGGLSRFRCCFISIAIIANGNDLAKVRLRDRIWHFFNIVTLFIISEENTMNQCEAVS